MDLGVGVGPRQGEAFGLGEEDFDFDAGVVHIRRQLRWDSKGRPYFCLPKGDKTRTVPVSPNLAKRVQNHLHHSPAVACTLPWRNPEPPTTELEARQRKPITVRLTLSTTQGNRINYSRWNKQSWRPALAAAGILKKIGEKVRTCGGRTRRYPIYELSRADMFHVLRHTYASTQLEAGESLMSVSEWLGHASPQTTLKHYAHFMPGAGKRGLPAMDAWFDQDPPSDQDPKPNVPEKSLGVLQALSEPGNRRSGR
ncbi:tyrosine-type recombinase/integrase [Streptomyces noursei]|uniref:tyrosine-type recombinase/integrase n=1 Tax=Streptomyces noursei TaxID=1971 RepID=UPI001E43A3D1|nr:site-specific integrase [Streptomyces noursei]MCZ1013321.1 site-specific integrase [Streptomyces noursei]